MAAEEQPIPMHRAQTEPKGSPGSPMSSAPKSQDDLSPLERLKKRFSFGYGASESAHVDNPSGKSRSGWNLLNRTYCAATSFRRAGSGALEATAGAGHQDDTTPDEAAVAACLRCIKQLKEAQSNMTDQELQSLVGEEDLQKQRRNLFVYKNRLVKGTLFHYAVFWTSAQARKGNGEEAGEVLKRLLRCRADLHSKATYPKDTTLNTFEAIHLAAGFRCEIALRVLVHHAREQGGNTKEYVNTYCKLGEEKFYTPLHDAMYVAVASRHCQGGELKASVNLLLKTEADPSNQNNIGYTPLHWLAMTGLQQEEELEEVVHMLLEYRAPLDVQTYGTDKAEPKIPLQMAASDESQFPRRLMHLLAPSVQCVEHEDEEARFAETSSRAEDATNPQASVSNHRGTESNEPSVFDDLCLLACHNTQAAEMLASKLTETEGERLLNKIMRDAQKDNAVDRMAQLFHMAPKAAARMLELLLVRPIVDNPGKHPIRTRALLWNSLYPAPMRCDYQTDVKRIDEKGIFRSLKVPNWTCDSGANSSEHRVPWHERLIVVPQKTGDQIEYMEDVDTMALLMPNILDIDIFMALASTKEAHRSVFSTVSVQGIIHCIWDHILVHPWCLRVVLLAVEIGFMFTWSTHPISAANTFAAGDEGSDSSDTNSCANAPQDCNTSMTSEAGPDSDISMPICWAVIAAGFVRDLFTLLWRFWNHCEKYWGHLQKYLEWKTLIDDTKGKEPPSVRESEDTGEHQDKAKEHSPVGQAKDTGDDQDQAKEQSRERPPSLHALWRPQAFVSVALLVELALLLLRFLFLFSTLTHSGDLTQLRLELTGTALLHCMQLIYMFRLAMWGKKVTTIMNVFFSGSIFEMLVVVLCSFGAVSLAGYMLTPEQQQEWRPVLVNTYKGLLFGDGGALDGLGLSEGKSEGTAKTIFAVGGTVAFNICMLNLIIAIYGNEYERLEKVSEVHFLRERAKSSCDFLLGVPRVSESIKGHVLQAVLGAICLGVVTLASSARAHYVFVAAAMIGLAEVFLQAWLMTTPWFPWRPRTDDKEGPKEEHFLWLCYGKAAASASSDDADGDNVVVERLTEVEKQVDAVQGRLANLEKTLANLDKKLDRVLDAFQSPMSE